MKKDKQNVFSMSRPFKREDALRELEEIIKEARAKKDFLAVAHLLEIKFRLLLLLD